MDKISETADRLIAYLFGSTEFYGDPKPHTIEILKELVEEKFTSHNKRYTQCPKCGSSLICYWTCHDAYGCYDCSWIEGHSA